MLPLSYSFQSESVASDQELYCFLCPSKSKLGLYGFTSIHVQVGVSSLEVNVLAYRRVHLIRDSHPCIMTGSQLKLKNATCIFGLP